MNVLIIDDDAQFLMLLGDIMKRRGFGVYTALNGIAALEILSCQKIDLIISDVIMSDTPIMSFTCTLRNLHPDIPIILVSGLPFGPLITNSLTLGASEFVPKPINLNQLFSTIERLKAA